MIRGLLEWKLELRRHHWVGLVDGAEVACLHDSLLLFVSHRVIVRHRHARLALLFALRVGIAGSTSSIPHPVPEVRPIRLAELILVYSTRTIRIPCIIIISPVP